MRLTILSIFSLLFFSCQSQHEEKAATVIDQPGVFKFKPLSPQAKQAYADAIQPLYENVLTKHGFSGSILMAKNGEIVFEDYHGLINFKTKENITASTPFHLASISKTFTGMMVLHLWEQGKLSLDDSIQHFFPKFPYHNITIQQLLSHRSGLPYYADFMDDKTVVAVKAKNKKGKTITRYVTVKTPNALKPGFSSNYDMLQYMIDKKPPRLALPGKVFHYCNTNFSILALIIEKVTGTSFPVYMKDSLFDKLGMKNTFVFSVADINKYVPSYQANNAPYPLEKLDCIYGDKNVYSTVRDIYLWDKALYEGSFVSKPTLDMAFRPYSNEKRTNHNYGLGWRILTSTNENGTIIYHNGWWHGNNTVFTRMIGDTATLIILGNKYNRNIYKAKEMASVFTGMSDSTKVD